MVLSLRSKIVFASLASLGLIGCSRQVMPKGKGASGSELKVLESAETGLELINKFSEAEKKGFDALHRKWDYAFKLKEGLSAPELARVDKVRGVWDSLIFGDVASNRRIYYKITLKTPIGGVDVQLMNDMVPDAARNFIAMAKTGMFDGVEMRAKGRQIWFGQPEGKDAYTIQAMKIVMPLPPAVLAMVGDGDRLGAQRFVFCSDTDPTLANRAMPIGRITNAHALDMIKELIFKDGQKPGSMKIDGVIIEEQSLALFEGAKASVPSVNEAGEIVSREMQMFLPSKKAGTVPDAKSAPKK